MSSQANDKLIAAKKDRLDSDRIDAENNEVRLAVSYWLWVVTACCTAVVSSGWVSFPRSLSLCVLVFPFVLAIGVFILWPWLILFVWSPVREAVISLGYAIANTDRYLTNTAVAKHQASQLKSAVNHRTRDRHKSELAVKEKKLLDIRQQSRADLRSENAKTRITQLESAMREETFREHQADVRADLKDAEALFASIDAVEDPAARAAIAKQLTGEI